MNFFKQDASEKVPEGIYSLDTERRITDWNKECEEITGFSKEEVLGKCCSEIF